MKQQAPFKALKIGPDGWAHAVQLGRYLIDRPDRVLDPAAEDGARTEITEIVDADDCAAMLQAFVDGGREPLLVDADHSADIGSSTEAYFWVKDLRLCDDGLEALLEPTDIGQTAVVAGKRFRFLSPVFPWEHFKYDDDAKTVGHPRLVSNFGLTNFPRMRGIRPVVNAAGPAAAAINATNPNKKGASMDPKTMLCALLQLDPATATDEQIQTAYDAAMAAQADTEADAAMNAAGIPDDKTVRDGLKASFKADKGAGCNAIAATAAALNAMKAVKPAAPAAPAQRPLHAEASKTPPALHAAEAGKSAARNAALNSLIAATPGIDRSLAFSMVRHDHPELF